ncbi:MAG: PASTA domain-containing protein [Coriobacteriia bacterium]|nr:PASTA domain-containing protein [Coriobacteriia bacterium]
MKRTLIVVMLMLVMLALTGCGTAIPDTKGMTLAQSQAALKTAGFILGKVTYDESAQGSPGAVIAQEPAGGKTAKPGSTVVLTVAGPAPVPTPDLAGLNKLKAEAALVAAGLVLGDVTESYDASIPAGVVTTQTPTPREEAPRGSMVALVISKGREPVSVPNVKGKPQKKAEAILKNAGFRVKVGKQANKARKGTVIAQKPSGGKARPGSTILLKVSTGVVMVRVPNMRGVFMSNAEARLKAAGFRVTSTGVYAGDGGQTTDGTVYKQSPAAGSTVPKGSRVTIWWGYEYS